MKTDALKVSQRSWMMRETVRTLSLDPLNLVTASSDEEACELLEIVEAQKTALAIALTAVHNLAQRRLKQEQGS